MKTVTTPAGRPDQEKMLTFISLCSAVSICITISWIHHVRQTHRVITNDFLLPSSPVDERKDVGEVSCSVLKHGRCRHRVEWLDEDNTVNGGEETSRPECRAVFPLATSLLKQTHRYPEGLKCKVTNVETQAEDVFAFSKKKPGEIRMSCLKSFFVTFHRRW